MAGKISIEVSIVPVRDSWRNFWRLSGFEKGAVLESAAGHLATAAGLRLAGFQRWKSFLEWTTPSRIENFRSPASEQVSCAHLLMRLESSTSRRLPFRVNCLEKSLVLWWLLRRRLIPAEIRIGARKESERFEAHAWVEVNGAVLDGPDDMHLHFVPFNGPLYPTES
jgi:hypothetical protein